MMKVEKINNCIFDKSKNYRYVLKSSISNNEKVISFIGLNPSIADEYKDDNTVRRCKYFAKKFDFGHIHMLNIFSIIGTDPIILKSVNRNKVIGKLNDYYIEKYVKESDLIVLACGNGGLIHNRVYEILELINSTIYCFGTTKNNMPKHPLYLKNNTTLKVFP